MPRYYFPSWDGDSLLPDDEGLEMDGAEAISGLTEMARDVLPRSYGGRVLRLQVREERDRPLVEFRLTLEIVRES